jgi:hypothetical protein
MPASAWSATATINASKDNSIYQNNVNNSAGGAAGIFVGSTGVGSPRRGLLAFDVAANVPSNAIITGAQLRLVLGNAPNATSQTIGLHRLQAGWGEGTAGNSTPGIGGGGNGFAAANGDATWNARFLGTSLWTNPGGTGDFNATASASLAIGGAIDNPHTWLSTPGLVSDVQGWLNNPSTNFGWALVNTAEATSQSIKVFYSRSATQNSTGGTLDPAWRPLLTVTYVIPEPGTVALVLFGGMLQLVSIRRKTV